MQKTKTLLNIFALFLCAFPMMAIAQGGGKVTVRGVITSAEDKQPLIGASVIAGPTNGVTTLADGSYTIEVAAGTVLKIQYIGYKNVERVVPDGTMSVRFDFALESDAQRLDDVVVIAYGVRKKGTIAGSVSTVKAEKVENTPTAAFDQALQGQVPGLTVLSNSGEPSAAAAMTIRGTNSINSGTSPLYILDGIPISAADFNTINPADIESLSVLKDASSTSIYGARAANGVIVITTKRGQFAERPKINYRMQMGFSQIAYGNWDLMNTDERIQYEQELGLTAGKNYNLLRKTNVNWLDEVFNSAAMLQNYELSVAGATDKTNYFFSGGFYSQDGTATGSSFDRYSFRTNVEHRAAPWLKVGSNIMLNYQEITKADEGAYTLVTPISAARFMMPYYSPYKADGSLASVNDHSWKGTGQNPLEWSKYNPLTYKKYKLISSLFADFTLTKGLTLRAQGSVDYSHTTAFSVSYPSYMPNLGSGTAGRSSTDGISLAETITLNYQFRAGDKHSFNFLLGQEGSDYRYESFQVMAKGQNNDKLTNVSSGTRVSSWGDVTDADYAFLSFFGRGEYNYDSRYYVDFSVRTDGSSRFGTSGRWAQFWSVGAMWNLRNEQFMENSRSWLTNAQIAISTGTTGNSSIPNYEHLALVSGGLDYMGDAGVAPSQPGNESLEWEKVWTSNLAFHFGFWDRLNVDLELYNKKTTNMLMAVPEPYSTSNGFGYKWKNVGAMVNRGAELNLTATVLSHKDFQWILNANASYNKNKITELYSNVTEFEMSNTNTKLVVGHPVGEFYINRYAGVNSANGDALWYTKDGKITNKMSDDDKVLVGKSYEAPWQGGFGTTFNWKGLALSAQFSWVADRWMINNDRYFDESNGRFAAYNQSKRLLTRWKQPGDITDIPRNGVYTEFDSRLLEDASFLRLKNLMLSYTFPANLIKRTRFMSGVKLYAQAQNLLTFTNFSGLDPEGTTNMYAAQYPMARQYTFGLEITF